MMKTTEFQIWHWIVCVDGGARGRAPSTMSHHERENEHQLVPSKV